MLKLGRTNVRDLQLSLLLSLVLHFPELSHAQSLQYMDSSGNIHFANKISDVPEEYREQVGYRDEKKELEKLLTGPPPAQASGAYQEEFRRWQQQELEKRNRAREEREREALRLREEKARIEQEKKAAAAEQQRNSGFASRTLPVERGKPTPTPLPKGPATF